ncbi:MAG: YiaA/YiaB family inner membrane protein [Pseudomonadota bacterium]
MQNTNENGLIINFNLAGIVVAYVMLGLSIWMAPVDLSTKGFWAVGVLMLTLSLVNFVKYRFDERLNADRIQQLEAAKNEKLLEEFVVEKAAA